MRFDVPKELTYNVSVLLVRHRPAHAGIVIALSYTRSPLRNMACVTDNKRDRC